MEMEIDPCPNQGGAKDGDCKATQMIVILVGAPGSGKSTFCDHVIRASSRSWARICQDVINNGKSGTKTQCLTNAASALNEGKSIFIDRCNLDIEQRAEFLKLAGPQIDLHAVVLDLPAKLCISRCVKRSGHEGNLQGGKAAAVVNRMMQKKELPKLGEGFCRITFCQNEKDVQDAIDAYSALSLTDTLPSGCFGQKKQDTKVQAGIMKFLKKLDGPCPSKSDGSTKSSIPDQMENKKRITVDVFKRDSSLSPVSNETRHEEVTKTKATEIGASAELTLGDDLDLIDNPTLAFPSISTADFQFDHEKASEIIVEKVQECLDKCEDAKLVLVDLSHKSRILSLVKAKAAAKNIDSDRFHTFVGDITQLYSKGGLRCNVIANAANWRLKPGGGGVNAAIFNAAGPSLEIETKKRAGTLSPGKAVVVPLASSAPLFSREGITHVIHVLGPNMNPQRPNCLNNNYDEGCRILQKAYSSLFEGFISVVRQSSSSSQPRNKKLRSDRSEAGDQVGARQENDSGKVVERGSAYEVERTRKCKENTGLGDCHAVRGKSGNENRAAKSWGSWAQALYNIALHPENHKNDVLEVTSDVVVLNDLYAKARKHILVLAKLPGLDRLADVHIEHLQLLRTMHEVGMNWAKKFIQDDASLIFRLGYHSVPSMRQLHLHVISQDFDSQHLKNKKHWNSFNTAFFLDSVDVIDEVSKNGKASISANESLLTSELRCHRCKSAHPNIPRLKSHISNCHASFPSKLLQNGRLVQAAS